MSISTKRPGVLPNHALPRSTDCCDAVRLCCDFHCLPVSAQCLRQSDPMNTKRLLVVVAALIGLPPRYGHN